MPAVTFTDRPLSDHHALPAATPASVATFDGSWNVQITSKNAACPSGSNVAIGISNGHVASNNAMVTASGRVADAGVISVRLSSGTRSAVGTGRLTATSGSGTWRRAMCSGTWTATADLSAGAR